MGERISGNDQSNPNWPTRRCSEREPADSLRDKSNVIGGWLPSLTFALDGENIMSEPPSKPKDLATKVFANKKFVIPWGLSLFYIFAKFGIPFQRFLVVLWVRGSDAYFHHGVRAVGGKTVKFSDGGLVPDSVDAVTGAPRSVVVMHPPASLITAAIASAISP